MPAVNPPVNGAPTFNDTEIANIDGRISVRTDAGDPRVFRLVRMVDGQVLQHVGGRQEAIDRAIDLIAKGHA